MAANVWKVEDVFGRTFYYEEQKKFEKRFKTACGEYADRVAWEQQHRPNQPLPAFLRSPKGFRIENDVWVEQQLDKEMMKEYLSKRETRRAKREARQHGYKF